MSAKYANLNVAEVLAKCLGENASDAWQELVARTQPVVARAAARVARQWNAADAGTVEELVQETYTKLLSGGRLQQFVPQHPDAFFGYVRVVATRVAQDYFKARQAGKRRDSANRDVPPDDDFPDRSAANPQDQVLLQQVEACVRTITGGGAVNRDLLVFQLYYRLGMTAAAIASIPALDLSVKGVESLLARLTRQAREQLVAAGGVGRRENTAASVSQGGAA